MQLWKAQHTHKSSNARSMTWEDLCGLRCNTGRVLRIRHVYDLITSKEMDATDRGANWTRYSTLETPEVHAIRSLDRFNTTTCLTIFRSTDSRERCMVQWIRRRVRSPEITPRAKTILADQCTQKKPRSRDYKVKDWMSITLLSR